MFDVDVAGLLTTLAQDRFALGDRAAAAVIAEQVMRWLADEGLAVSPVLFEILSGTPSEAVMEVPASCVIGAEARVRRFVALLRGPSAADGVLRGLDGLVAELDALPRSASVDDWRILLGYRLVRAGHPGLAGQAMASLLNRADGDAARISAERVLFSVGQSGELVLQRGVFEEQLADLDASAADAERMGVLDALATTCNELGDWHAALEYGIALLVLRRPLLGPDHPETLATRNNVAGWTGRCGDSREALRLFQELLPDMARVLGRDHPDTLSTRSNVACWTGSCGDSGEALRLFEEMLPDMARVLGRDHPDTLSTRSNVACWTGECGDSGEALRLFQELFPNQTRVLGRDHPDTLSTRSNVAYWTGRCGDSGEALRLYREVLAVRIHVFGPNHPDTEETRQAIASLSSPDA